MRTQFKSLKVVSLVAISLALATAVLAQEDVRPLIDLNDAAPSVAPGVDAEDIPPPRPVPTPPGSVLSRDESPTSNTFRPRITPDASGEIHAYDFGISAVPVDSGLRVSGVIVGSPAESAGVKPNDIIIEINGADAGRGEGLSERVESVSVSRAGDARTLTVGSYDANQVETRRRVSSQAVPAPQATPSRASTVTRTYSVPRTTYSAPQSYRYAPRYNTGSYSSSYYRSSSPYSYRSSAYGYGGRGYSSYYRSRPSVTIGFGVGTGGGGLYGPGRGFYGPSRGFYGPGIGPRYYGYGGGRGIPGRGRSGVGISIGGIGIRL